MKKKKEKPEIKVGPAVITGRLPVIRKANFCPFCGKDIKRISHFGGGSWYFCDCGKLNEDGKEEAYILYRIYASGGGAFESICYTAEVTCEIPEEMGMKVGIGETDAKEIKTAGK